VVRYILFEIERHRIVFHYDAKQELRDDYLTIMARAMF
jgi:hypothetical protein